MPYWMQSDSSGLSFGLCFGVALISVHDALHERMPHDVVGLEVRECDAAHPLQYALRLDQAILVPARQVDLRDVAGHDRFAAESDAGEKHLHLFRRGVL